jgi:hypothetical protein
MFRWKFFKVFKGCGKNIFIGIFRGLKLGVMA